jgi:hypothetical protein
MALKHIDHAQNGDVIVYDRGYSAVWFFKYHLATWIGLVPRQFSTGGKSTLLGISKGGS